MPHPTPGIEWQPETKRKQSFWRPYALSAPPSQIKFLCCTAKKQLGSSVYKDTLSSAFLVCLLNGSVLSVGNFHWKMQLCKKFQLEKCWVSPLAESTWNFFKKNKDFKTLGFPNICLRYGVKVLIYSSDSLPPHVRVKIIVNHENTL